VKTAKRDIYEELKTKEDMQAFVEASIAEAETDTDPSLLARARWKTGNGHTKGEKKLRVSSGARLRAWKGSRERGILPA
jgi:hypothetical protein